MYYIVYILYIYVLLYSTVQSDSDRNLLIYLSFQIIEYNKLPNYEQILQDTDMDTWMSLNFICIGLWVLGNF